MYSIVATSNADAVEIHYAGRSVATIRNNWLGEEGWTLVLPEGGLGCVNVCSDLMRAALDWIDDREDNGNPDTECETCGEELDHDCNGNLRCPTCDSPCPCCYDGGGPGADDDTEDWGSVGGGGWNAN